MDTEKVNLIFWRQLLVRNCLF